MKDGGTNELLELGGAIRRGYSSVITNLGKIIAAITLSVAVLVTFTDVTLSRPFGEEFTATLIIMLLSSYMMYFSLMDSGEREGEESEEFRIAREEYLAVRGRITPRHIDSLRKFCLDYARRELEYRRLSFLGERGYSESDLAAYRRGAKFPLRAVVDFKKAERMRAVKLSPALLLSRSSVSTKSELTSPGYRKIVSSLLSLLPSTICMIFTVSVMLTAKEGMTLSSVIDGIVKLSALPIIGFKGALDGYRFAKEDKSAWLETKARLIASYLESECASMINSPKDKTT